MGRDISNMPDALRRSVLRSIAKGNTSSQPSAPNSPARSGGNATPVKHRRTEEDSLQKATARYLRSHFPGVLAWHTPNGGKRSPATGAMLKAMGTMPGVPDWTFILASGKASFIELKAEKGIVSDNQKGFKGRAVARGCPYCVVRSLAEFVAVLDEWSTKGLF